MADNEERRDGKRWGGVIKFEFSSRVAEPSR
jgi:hypothetical protein